MDLLCCESLHDYELGSSNDTWPVTKAHPDPVLLRDERVLYNLMNIEDKYTVNVIEYLTHVQTDITQNMRCEVASWMLGVCEEEMCQDDVLPLAMNFMDRFLRVLVIKRTQLQLLGSVCLFLSSKLKESRPLSAEKIIAYTDYSITMDDLMGWELLVLGKLRWDLSAITAYDCLDHILIRLQLSSDDRLKIKRHAQTFISLCAIDGNFSIYPASMVSAATIAVAANGLQSRSNKVGDVKPQHMLILSQLHSITGVELDCLKVVLKQIEEMLSGYVSSVQQTSENELKNSKINSQPETPTEVQDIHF
ncbi:CCND3 (predicted) [Pycnogonum litorale]